MKRKNMRWQPKPTRPNPEHNMLTTALIGVCVVLLGLVVGMAASSYLGWR